MKIFLLILTLLFFLFFGYGIYYHILNMFSVDYSEKSWSHVVHIISYAVCMLAIGRHMAVRLPLYIVGMLYPFYFHAVCLWKNFATHGSVHPICLLVLIILPLGALILAYKRARKIP